MTTPIEEIAALLDRLQGKGEMSTVKGVLVEISTALADLVGILERPPKDDDQAIAEAIRAIRIPAPQVTVTPQIAAPDVQVHVAAPNVTVQAPSQPAGWVLIVKSRDGNGAIREVSIKPEK